MSFYASNNNIKITDIGGNTVFNTDWKMPTIVSILEGSITIPERGRVSTQTNSFHKIASVDPQISFVISTCKIKGGSSYPWKNTAFNSSGSTLTNLGWQSINDTWKIAAARTVNFEINNNTLQIREQYYNLFNTVALKSFTLKYKVYLGRYE